MTISNDCVNTQSENGRNLTPLSLVKALHHVFPSLELDPASDVIANEFIKAQRIHTFEDDGFTQGWNADSVFVNPPGRSLTGGTCKDRVLWSQELKKAAQDKKYVKAPRPEGVKQVEATQWFRKLFDCWLDGDVGHAIGLVYRMASIGSLGCDLLSQSTLCVTAAGAASEAINGSGRFAFDIIKDCYRVPQTSNTQSSGIFLLSDSKVKERLFREAFEQFGVIK